MSRSSPSTSIGTAHGPAKSRRKSLPERAIAEFVRGHLQDHPGDRVAIVGNSWGGHTVLEVVQQLGDNDAPLAVDLAVFLDASSTGRGPAKPKALPANVNRAVSYFTRNMFVWAHGMSGCGWKMLTWGDSKNNFIRDGQPPYNWRLDAQTHVAAEWDEAIHKDIASRLVKLLPQTVVDGRTNR